MVQGRTRTISVTTAAVPEAQVVTVYPCSTRTLKVALITAHIWFLLGLNLSCHNTETILFNIDSYYGDLS